VQQTAATRLAKLSPDRVAGKPVHSHHWRSVARTGKGIEKQVAAGRAGADARQRQAWTNTIDPPRPRTPAASRRRFAVASGGPQAATAAATGTACRMVTQLSKTTGVQLEISFKTGENRCIIGNPCCGGRPQSPAIGAAGVIALGKLQKTYTTCSNSVSRVRGRTNTGSANQVINRPGCRAYRGNPNSSAEPCRAPSEYAGALDPACNLSKVN